MPFECKKTVVNLLDDHHEYHWSFKSEGSWEEFVATYEDRGKFGCTFEKVSEREFIFVTSNASQCTFVRTDA